MINLTRTLLTLTLLAACGPEAPAETTSTSLEPSSSGSDDSTSGSSGSVVGTTTGTPSTGSSSSSSSSNSTESSGSTESIDPSTGTGVTSSGTSSSSGPSTGDTTMDSSTGEGTTEESPTTGGGETCDYVIPCNSNTECMAGTVCEKLPTEGSVCVAPCVGSDAATNCQAAMEMCALPAPLKCQHSASAGLFCFPVL